MSDIEKMIREIERRHEEELRKQVEAENEKALADEMKAEAIRKEKAAKAAVKELEAARAHAEKAQSSYSAFSEKAEEPVIINETTVIKEEPEVIEREITVERTGDGYGRGFVTGAAALALIAAGAWALSKDPMTGEVRLAKFAKGLTKDNKENAQEAELIIDDETMMERSGFVYDYENNVVIIQSQTDPNATYAYDYEANSADDTKYVDAEGNAIPVVTEAGQSITNPNVNNDININGEYVELTTERFEELTAGLIQELEGLGLQVSREDIIKYVMIRNIDKLRQDNNELIEQIVGTQDIFEVISDSWHVRDAIRNYNLLYFDKYQNTDGFISAVDGVFDETQKAKATELERRIYEIGSYCQDEEKYNELTYTLLRDLDNPLNPISQLEAGVSYGMQSIDMYFVRTVFGTYRETDGMYRYIKLNDVNSDLIKYFISFPEDDAMYSDNALVNGNVSNIIRLLSECDVKTRTK